MKVYSRPKRKKSQINERLWEQKVRGRKQSILGSQRTMSIAISQRTGRKRDGPRQEEADTLNFPPYNKNFINSF